MMIPPSISIRSEAEGDWATIRRVIREAYASVPYSDHREHVMVERLRATDAYLPALSLLAEIEGEAVGHILLTLATIGRGETAATTLALAPLSVVPSHQRTGIGSRLVAEAHERAAALGFTSILLIGPASYYARFGYKPLGRLPIALPFAAPPEDCMIRALAPDALDRVAGMVQYPEGWLDH